MPNYINNKEFLNEIIQSKKEGNLTPKAIEMITLMANRMSTALKWKNSMDKQDCISFAITDVLLYWKNFDENHPKSNAFSYFSQLIKNGLAKGMNVCHPEIRKNVKVINFSQNSENIYNI